MKWRMERARQGQGIYAQMARFGREQQATIQRVLRIVEQQGALGPAACRPARSVPGLGGIGVMKSTRWNGCSPLAWSRLPVVEGSSGSMIYPSALFPPRCSMSPWVRLRSAACCCTVRRHWVSPPKRPARLFSPRARRQPQPLGRTGRGWATAGVPGAGLEATRVLPGAAETAAQRTGQRIVVTVRFADMGAQPHRAPVRLSLSAGDLHPARKARVWLLRAAVSAQRAHCRARRPAGRACPWAPGRACRARGRAGAG